MRSESPELSGSSFAGSDIARIHGYLNRLLSIGADPEEHAEEGDLSTAFNLGDAVADGADALEDGFSDENPKPKVSADVEEERLRKEKERRRLEAVRRKQDQKALIVAVRQFSEQVASQAASNGLRTIITILAAAGMGSAERRTSFQILPASGDANGSWPRLMGKALGAFFDGRAPAIGSLRIDDYFDAIPSDVVACWASCMWSAHAVITACEQLHEHETLLRSVKDLRSRIYLLTGLRTEEFSDPRIWRVFNSMNERYAASLGLDPTATTAGHALMLGQSGLS